MKYVVWDQNEDLLKIAVGSGCLIEANGSEDAALIFAENWGPRHNDGGEYYVHVVPWDLHQAALTLNKYDDKQKIALLTQAADYYRGYMKWTVELQEEEE